MKIESQEIIRVAHGDERWVIWALPQNCEWLNMRAAMESTRRNRKLGACRIGRGRTRHSLAWNGSRFCASKELQAMQVHRPWLLSAFKRLGEERYNADFSELYEMLSIGS